MLAAAAAGSMLLLYLLCLHLRWQHVQVLLLQGEPAAKKVLLLHTGLEPSKRRAEAVLTASSP
jgi:hypothetical protein